MFADRNCFKPAMKLFFGFVLAGSLLHARAQAQQLTSCTVANPSTPCIQKFVDPLPYPPFAATTPIISNTVDSYEIAAREILQPVLSCSNSSPGLPNPNPNCTATLPKTAVFAYGSNAIPYDPAAPTTVCAGDGTDAAADGTDTAPCFFYPAPSIVALTGRPVHVKWINDITCHTGDTTFTGCTVGNFLPYPGATTPGRVTPSFTNHTANPRGICDGNATTPSDCKGVGGYTGPVPFVVHLHGVAATSESDGIPEAWNLPKNGTYDLAKYPFSRGHDYCQENPLTYNTLAAPSRDPNCRTRTSLDHSYQGDGASRYVYLNSQFGTTLFFHDHSLGVTTENVYMGLAGAYILAGTNQDGPIQSSTGWCGGGINNPCATNPFSFKDDLPSDCSIRADGNCLGTTAVTTVASTKGGLPQGDCTSAGIQAGNCFLIPLVITDKAFNADGSLRFSENGNVIVVNGKTWPVANVQPRKYRFKIVIGAPTSRFDLTFPSANNDHPGTPVATMTEIAGDQGYLPRPASVTKVSLMPGERADVIIDFEQFFGCAPPYGPGCTVDLLNANGSGDRGTIMRFNVSLPIAGCDVNNPNPFQCVPFMGGDTSCNLLFLSCTSGDTLPHRASGSTTTVRQVSLFDDHLSNCTNPGCVGSTPLPWDGPSTENPSATGTEIWELYDFQDSHPMHLHLASFEVLGRVSMATGAVTPPGPGETGFKDTVQANAGQITRVRVVFPGADGTAYPGLFAWHCHINPHEDNEMMRPMCAMGSGSSTDAENFCK